MGTNTLNDVGTGLVATDKVNQYKDALSGDIVPRNVAGVPQGGAASVGTPTLPFQAIHANEVRFGNGETLDDTQIDNINNNLSKLGDNQVNYILDQYNYRQAGFVNYEDRQVAIETTTLFTLPTPLLSTGSRVIATLFLRLEKSGGASYTTGDREIFSCTTIIGGYSLGKATLILRSGERDSQEIKFEEEVDDSDSEEAAFFAGGNWVMLCGRLYNGGQNITLTFREESGYPSLQLPYLKYSAVLQYRVG